MPQRYRKKNIDLNVSMDNLVVMKVLQSLQDLFGVEDDGSFIVLQRTPLGAQER